MARFEMSGGAKFWYYFINIFTFASLYFVKVAVMKALEEFTHKSAK